MRTKAEIEFALKMLEDTADEFMGLSLTADTECMMKGLLCAKEALEWALGRPNGFTTLVENLGQSFERERKRNAVNLEGGDA